MDQEVLKSEKSTIVCIPGLGGHRSVFHDYGGELRDYTFQYIELVDWQKTLKELKAVAQKEKNVILLCNCYGLQLGLRLIEALPSTVKQLVVIEPFFAEFHWWREPGKILVTAIISFLEFTDRLGLRRKSFPYKIDYSKLTRYPIYVQPIFDMRWQNLTDYFKKVRDILNFQLPAQIRTKTLFILSSKGFLRSPRIKNALLNTFVNADVVYVKHDTHNIISAAHKEITASMKNWLIKN